MTTITKRVKQKPRQMNLLMKIFKNDLKHFQRKELKHLHCSQTIQLEGQNPHFPLPLLLQQQNKQCSVKSGLTRHKVSLCYPKVSSHFNNTTALSIVQHQVGKPYFVCCAPGSPQWGEDGCMVQVSPYLPILTHHLLLSGQGFCFTLASCARPDKERGSEQLSQITGDTPHLLPVGALLLDLMDLQRLLRIIFLVPSCSQERVEWHI